jgi:glycosyltransferase involved in cell wall biosynthesis
MKLASVIIPTYNMDFCVGDAVKSALKQSYKNIEVIVIDDGGTDSTEQVIRQIQDPRLFYYYKPHSGLSATRNKGIQMSKGQYIAFLDSDDTYPVDYLKVMIGNLEKQPHAGLAYSQFINFYPDGKQCIGISNERALSGRLASSFFEKNSPCMIPSVTVLRKSALEDMWLDENLLKTEDLDFFLRLSVKTDFLFVPEIMVCRNALPNSMSSKYNIGESLLYPMILERFCYLELPANLGISTKKAKTKISNLYRRCAKMQRIAGNRKAALLLANRAIQYIPWNMSYWREWIRCFILSSRGDKTYDWQLPPPLPKEVKKTNVSEVCFS